MSATYDKAAATLRGVKVGATFTVAAEGLKSIRDAAAKLGYGLAATKQPNGSFLVRRTS